MMISLFRPVLARWIGAIIAALGAAGSPRANEPVIVTLPALERFEPLPELVAYAKGEGNSHRGFRRADRSAKSASRQRRRRAGCIPDGGENRAVAGASDRPGFDREGETRDQIHEQRIYTTTGHEVVLDGAPAAVAVRVIGPMSVGRPPQARARKPKDVWSGAVLNGVFLRLGLDRASATSHRLTTGANARGIQGDLGWGPTQFEPERIKAGRRSAESIGLTVEDERALIGSTPALIQFFLVAAATPGVRDILRDMLGVSVWSIVSHGGFPPVAIDLVPAAGPLDMTLWGMPPWETHGLPFVMKIGDQPRLICNMAVVAPRPPYVTSAGIVGLAVHRVDDPTSSVILRVIASRAPEAKSATE